MKTSALSATVCHTENPLATAKAPKPSPYVPTATPTPQACLRTSVARWSGSDVSLMERATARGCRAEPGAAARPVRLPALRHLVRPVVGRQRAVGSVCRPARFFEKPAQGVVSGCDPRHCFLLSCVGGRLHRRREQPRSVPLAAVVGIDGEDHELEAGLGGKVRVTRRCQCSGANDRLAAVGGVDRHPHRMAVTGGCHDGLLPRPLHLARLRGRWKSEVGGCRQPAASLHGGEARGVDEPRGTYEHVCHTGILAGSGSNRLRGQSCVVVCPRPP